MRRIVFASTNKNKFNEILTHMMTYNIEIEFVKFESIEIQSNRLDEIAKQKARDAYRKIGRPLIVEDTGLFIDSLRGFPGPYSSYVLGTLGNQGILDLLLNRTSRVALFKSIVAYVDDNCNMVFSGDTRGTIGDRITKGGWGYDPIFIPEDSSVSYGQMRITDKIAVSHRTKALNNFAKWYCENYLGGQR
ncbi:MAG TPA: RdgB/HAM1 family non-canonical purine NTP pyrophosphatase [Nitrososphaeraceae archaeon]|nr:RdgB/HAM1 family non-canonical purine NTP pyrophosphatase [Nitrososphaeraceae archaeon]